jgi:hypothetical protein
MEIVKPATLSGESPSSCDTAVTPEEKDLLAAPAAKSSPPPPGRRITRELLVNRLNLINFQDGCIQARFVHREYGQDRLVPARPQPCAGEKLVCAWPEGSGIGQLIETHDLKDLLVPRGDKFIRLTPAEVSIDAHCARLTLPEVSYEVSQRRVERQSCRNVAVTLIQNSSTFGGALLDFSAFSFRVGLKATAPQRFDWIDPALPVNVILHSGQQTFYSGECRVLRQTQGSAACSYVLEPLKQQIQRYRRAEIRSQRQRLNPSPNLICRHPLTGKRVDLKVTDLSGSGFAVEEDPPSAVLLPGLILPAVELRFANSFTLCCSAQVVFRKAVDRKNGRRIRCGLALIDMSAQDHIKLLALLHQSRDDRSYICNDLDLEALWDFLFESGFIYPSKYAQIQKNRKQIRETYEKLYTRSPSIARHFVYQDNGIILAHMAMIRFWANTWLIHHHAARKSALNKAGLVVLDQIGRFIHETFRFSALHMDYLACYYRPQNKFPHKVFGGFAQLIGNPKECSIDPFAYVSSLKGSPASLPGGWSLAAAAPQDRAALQSYYDHVSGGLMLRAMDLEAGVCTEEEMNREFREHGFHRERHLFTLAHAGRQKAFMIANVADVGLNLSDLTSGIHVVVIEAEGLTRDVLSAAMLEACRLAGQGDVPALVYPVASAQRMELAFDKVYHLWAIDVAAQSQNYFKYLGRLTKYI